MGHVLADEVLLPEEARAHARTHRCSHALAHTHIHTNIHARTHARTHGLQGVCEHPSAAFWSLALLRREVLMRKPKAPPPWHITEQCLGRARVCVRGGIRASMCACMLAHRVNVCANVHAGVSTCRCGYAQVCVEVIGPVGILLK